MTDEAKALVERLREVGRDGVWKSGRNPTTAHPMCIKAADLIETQAREIARLRLDVEAQEALQVSAYHAGLRAGWNFGVSDDNAGMQAAMANTDHIKELRRIREARAALAGDSHE
jgi:hypothetical protein